MPLIYRKFIFSDDESRSKLKLSCSWVRESDGAHSASLTRSSLKRLLLFSISSLSRSPVLSLSLSGFPVKQRQLQCLRLEGPWLKLKPDSSCLSVDHGHLIWPSLQTSQLQIQINTPAKSSYPLLLLDRCVSLTSPELFRALWPRPKAGNASELLHPVPKFLCLYKCLLLSFFYNSCSRKYQILRNIF